MGIQFEELIILLLLKNKISTSLLVGLTLKVSISYLILTFLIISFTIILQNIVRGSDGSYLDVWRRLWGANFLDSVVSYFVRNNSNLLFNDFFYYRLKDLNMTSSDFHNFIILEGDYDFINGYSRTGFGSIFMLFGYVGVFITFFLIGYLMRIFYKIFINSPNNPFIYIFYSIVLISFQRILIEQLDFGNVQNFVFSIIFLLFIFYIYKFIFLKTHHNNYEYFN